MAFSAAVLAGGASTRMGSDKAFVEIEGRPMVSRVRDAVLAAGATELYTVGGDLDRLAELGLDARPDSMPGEGPLCALVDALTYAAHDDVVVMACDQPAITADVVHRLLEALVDVDGVTDVDAAVPVIDGIAQPLAAAYARRARGALAAAISRGERSPRRALDALSWRALHGIEPSAIADVDDPDDLARYAASRRRSATDTR